MSGGNLIGVVIGRSISDCWCLSRLGLRNRGETDAEDGGKKEG